MICSSCNTDKDISEFYKRKNAKSGYRLQCKKCISVAVNRRRICGIYKITSPSGRIYIGQSVDIKTRWCSYKNLRKTQVKLYKSFEKYGINKHIFEIIEECNEESLTSRELYWQKHYNSVDEGLNCIYVDENYSVFNRRNKNKRKIKETYIKERYTNEILDLSNGVFYYGFLDASKYYNYSRRLLTKMLKDETLNVSSLILVGRDNINKNNVEEYNRFFKCKEEFIVIDFNNKCEIGSTKYVSKKEGIKEQTLRAYLNGVANNPTNFIYKKDYILGLEPNQLCSSRSSKVKVINTDTKEVFISIKQVAIEYKISTATVSDYLNNPSKSKLPIMRFSEYIENNNKRCK